MAKDNSIARTMHDIGLAAWFGGSLMGATALNRAAGDVSEPKERSRVADAGWKAWTPINLAAIGAYTVGGTMLIGANKGRIAGQKGVAGTTMVKAILSATAMGATAYARLLGEKMIREGDVPVADGTTPNQSTPPAVGAAQRQLTILQWAIPLQVGLLIALGAKMGEQQRPKKVLAALAR